MLRLVIEPSDTTTLVAPESLAAIVLDDDESMRDLLRTVLETLGVRCLEAASVSDARLLLRTRQWDLLLCDVNLEDGSGLDAAREARLLCPEMAIVMVTCRDDPETGTLAFELGVFGYVVKPFGLNEIVIAVRNALRRRELERDRKQRIVGLERVIEERTAEISRVEKQISMRLLAAARYRDDETGTHIRRIGLYSAAMAGFLGWSEQDQESIGLTAPMHDVGKIGVPDDILRKPGRLTDEERLSMQSHTRIGAAILGKTGIGTLEMAADIAMFHHERWDGSVYPDGLAKQDIPLAARVVAVVDVYDALTHARCYKAAWPESRAIEVMRNGRGAHFDPELFGVFEHHLPELRQIRLDNPDSSGESDAESAQGEHHDS